MRYSSALTLPAKTGRTAPLGFERSEPNSEGRKRETPAAMAASMRRVWVSRATAARVETTASMPVRADWRAEREV